MTARKRRTGPPRCHNCKAPVAFFRSPFTGNVRAFNPRPVDMRTQQVEAAYPVWNLRAYKLADLIDDLIAARRCSHAEATEEAHDLPWHTLHACPQPTADVSGGER